MVSASRIDGGPQILSAGVRKTIQSIKEIVGNHSDIDIYLALKENHMDPNDATQKLLNQDPFHEVKRKRDKKKESAGNDSSTVPRGHYEVTGQGIKVNTRSDRNTRRGVYGRNSLPGVSREFRVVRDNRVNRSVNKEAKPAPVLSTTSTFENISGKGSTGSSNSEKPSASKTSSQGLNGLSDSHVRIVQDIESTGFVRKEVSEEKRVTFSSLASRIQAGKTNNARSQSAAAASSSTAIGVYSSSTDPVHVPSPDSRSSGSVGAIKREVGVVGVRRQSSDNSKSSVPSSSFSNSLLGGEGSAEALQPFTTISKNEVSQASESMMASMSVSRSLLGSHYSNRQQHQQPVSYQKASQPNKEWKPKTSQKPSLNSPGVIGTSTKSVSPPAHNSEDPESELAEVQDKLSRVYIRENQNVIIAQHIRVPETDRCQLTFGSFGKEFESASDLVGGFQVGAIGESNGEPVSSLSAPESSIGDASGSKKVDLVDEKIRSAGSDSPTSGSGGTSENQLPDKKESSSPQNLDNYADIGLVQGNSPSYDPSDSQQQEHLEIPGFSAYDSQTAYEFPYFRPSTDEAMRGQGLPTSQEALSLHIANNVPSSTIAMVQQQQQPPVAQMYPQVHVSHFANLMPYRQFLSPVYVPPMAMPGYSSSPAYPHPSNGNSYLLMPGGGTHLNANSLKYGVQQFKPVPAGNPTGFGNFSNPNGYAINTPGVVGGAAGLEDSSRIRYKDVGNLYVPNPQAETSEMWIQNPRELPGLQSTPYYNMPGQSPHAAYLPSHTGHASYNAAAAQSSHMQFPGLYHPPQPAAIANPHHLGPAMGGNVGVGVAAAAPGAQVGAYQQPQLGHLNWTTNF